MIIDYGQNAALGDGVVDSGRPGRNRTHNPRFWRAVLCQIELLAYLVRQVSALLSAADA